MNFGFTYKYSERLPLGVAVSLGGALTKSTFTVFAPGVKGVLPPFLFLSCGHRPSRLGSGWFFERKIFPSARKIRRGWLTTPDLYLFRTSCGLPVDGSWRCFSGVPVCSQFECGSCLGMGLTSWISPFIPACTRRESTLSSAAGAHWSTTDHF